MQKARRHGSSPLRPLVSVWFQVLFTPLFRVLFTFPSQYWFTIGLSVVFSLGGWSPHIQTGFHVSRHTRLIYFQVSSTGFSPSLIKLSNLFDYLQYTLGLVPFRSPLLWESQLISFPPGT